MNNSNISNKDKIESSSSDISFMNSESSYESTDTVIDDDFLFFNDDCDIESHIDDWKIVIADDDDQVHSMTKIILNDISFEGRSIKMISCFSGKETIEIIKRNPDTAILVLDVVMETERAGFDVVKYIRDELKNNTVRIILRTGEPGQAPEKEVIRNYDINDYKEKTELTAQKFYTTILTSLRAYKNLISVENSKKSLQKMVSYSTSFQAENKLNSLFVKILTSFDEILIDEFGGKLLDFSLIFSRSIGSEKFALSELYGNFDKSYINKNLDDMFDLDYIQKIDKVIKKKEKILDNNLFIEFYSLGSNYEAIIFARTKSTLNEDNISLINLHNLTISNSLSYFFFTKEQKQTKSKIIASKNSLSSILDSLTSMMFLIDSNFKINKINKAVEKYLELKKEEIINKSIFHLLPHIESFKNKINEVFLQKKGIDITNIELEHKNKENIFCNVSITPIELADSSGVVIRIDNTTELIQKDKQLLQSQKMESIGNLAGGLAHDFNNVLGGMVGSASLLKFSLKSKDKINTDYIISHLEIIENAGKRATDMVKQLLTLSRKQEYKLAPVDLNKSVKHVMKICSNSFDKSIILNPQYLKQYATVKADPTQIEQVILNICINASHAMTIMRKENEKCGGKLDLTITEFEADEQFCKINVGMKEIRYWKLDIIDNGIGMTNEIQNKIFDPFYTTKKEKEGTGLGLSMVYKIIKEHAGLILVKSTPKIGTTFSIYLPKVNEEQYSEEENNEAPIIKDTGTILILDDEELIIEAENEMLQNAGYEVLSFLKGSDLIETFKNKHHNIKAVIIDMNMPEMSGKEVFIELKKIDPNVKALLTSGYRLDSTLTEILDTGFKGFIEKPFTINRFLDAVSEVIEEA